MVNDAIVGKLLGELPDRRQPLIDAAERIVQLLPSVLVNTRLAVTGPVPTAMNTPLPYATD